MPEVHKNLGIPDEMFDKACVVFEDSCKKMNPKESVMKEFIKRISGLRHEICFPPIQNKESLDMENFINTSHGSNKIFLQLGQEIGLRQIVDSMLEQAEVNNFDLFRRGNSTVQDQKLIFKYSMFLSSLLDERFSWFHKEQEQSGQLQSLLISESDFETMIDYFRKACVKNDIKKNVIVNFLDWLESRKDDLCLGLETEKKDDSGANNPLIYSLEQQQKFEVFIERFFQAIQSCPELTQSDIFDVHESRQELVARITKILHCQNSLELEIDKQVLQSALIN